jgi:hypothetical protein
MKNYLRSLFMRWENFLTERRQDEKTIWLFNKALIIYVLFKLVIVWSVADIMIEGKFPTGPNTLIQKIFLVPAFVQPDFLNYAFGLMTAALVAMLWLKPSYLVNLIIFYLSLNLFYFRFPATNGSDFVLLSLSIYNIPLSLSSISNRSTNTIAISIFNFSRILAQIQVLLIYFISAWDKLNSEVWRSGKAFQYIGKLETIVNPYFSDLVSTPSASFILSWTTIAFELLFVTLVWKKRTRLFILCVGIVFHLIIWVALSLPDFALIMIVSYFLFLKDSDLVLISSRLRRQPQ